MSGGSYDYFCHKIRDFTDEVERNAGKNSLRLAFVKHLRLVEEAAHAIEWVDSGDYGEGDENKYIEAVLKATGADPETIAKVAAFDEVSKWFKEITPRA